MNRQITHYREDEGSYMPLVVRYYLNNVLILENKDASYFQDETDLVVIDGIEYPAERVLHYVEYNTVEIYLEDE